MYCNYMNLIANLTKYGLAKRKGSELYNRPMKSWLQDNKIEMIEHIMKKHIMNRTKELLEP